MNNYQLKKAAIEKLYKTAGKQLPSSAVMTDICRVLGRHPKGGLTPSQILRDYLGIKHEAPMNVLASPYRPPFRELSQAPHPRMADIERAQPPLWTPSGTGNWNQYSEFMLNNGRQR